jgi:hypothetical protein
VHVWTFRAENEFLPDDLRIGGDPAAHGDLDAEIRRFLERGIDGFFVDFPAIGVRVRDAYISAVQALAPAGGRHQLARKQSAGAITGAVRALQLQAVRAARTLRVVGKFFRIDLHGVLDVADRDGRRVFDIEMRRLGARRSRRCRARCCSAQCSRA